MMKTAAEYRAQYPNLPTDVTVHICREGAPMPADVAERVVEQKQLWIHENSVDIDPDGIMDNYIVCKCIVCGHVFANYLGD